MAKRADDIDTILIEYGTVPAERGGFLPFYTVNGRRHETWRPSGLDLDEARAMARQQAQEQASCYAGDWFITVKEAV